MTNLNINLPDSYEPSDGELNNLTYLTLKYGVDFPMRMVDFTVMKMMAGEVKGVAGIERYVLQVCEYAWDHLCGEPSEFSPNQLFEHMKPMLEEWYSKTSHEERAKID